MHTHKQVSIFVSFPLEMFRNVSQMRSCTAGEAEDGTDAQAQSRPDSEKSAINDVVDATAADSYTISDRNISSL